MAEMMLAETFSHLQVGGLARLCEACAVTSRMASTLRKSRNPQPVSTTIRAIINPFVHRSPFIISNDKPSEQYSISRPPPCQSTVKWSISNPTRKVPIIGQLLVKRVALSGNGSQVTLSVSPTRSLLIIRKSVCNLLAARVASAEPVLKYPALQ